MALTSDLMDNTLDKICEQKKSYSLYEKEAQKKMTDKNILSMPTQQEN